MNENMRSFGCFHHFVDHFPRFSTEIFTQIVKSFFLGQQLFAMKEHTFAFVIVKSLLIFFISLFDAFYIGCSVNGKSSFKAK